MIERLLEVQAAGMVEMCVFPMFLFISEPLISHGEAPSRRSSRTSNCSRSWGGYDVVLCLLAREPDGAGPVTKCLRKSGTLSQGLGDTPGPSGSRSLEFLDRESDDYTAFPLREGRRLLYADVFGRKNGLASGTDVASRSISGGPLNLPNGHFKLLYEE
jgi:hypothetical protein